MIEGMRTNDIRQIYEDEDGYILVRHRQQG